MNCPSCGHENLEGIDRCENCLAPFRDLDVPSAESAEGLARSVMEDNLGELEQDETICVEPDTPALEVARRMKNSNSGCALVVEGGKLVGIFTEHDVLRRMIGPEAAPGRAGKLQFVEPAIIDHSGDANDAAAAVEEMQLNAMPSADIPVAEMRADSAVVSEADHSERLANNPRLNQKYVNESPVKHLMTTNPEVLDETDSVAEALNRMSLGRYRHIPFKRSDGSYAVASIRSVLKYIAQEDW
jgi:CBS domain-containing protein